MSAILDGPSKGSFGTLRIMRDITVAKRRTLCYIVDMRRNTVRYSIDIPQDLHEAIESCRLAGHSDIDITIPETRRVAVIRLLRAALTAADKAVS